MRDLWWTKWHYTYITLHILIAPTTLHPLSTIRGWYRRWLSVLTPRKCEMRELITVSAYRPGSAVVANCNQPAVCQKLAGKCRRLASEACLQLPRDAPIEGSGGKLFAIYGSRLGVLYAVHGEDLEVQWFCCGLHTSTQHEMKWRNRFILQTDSCGSGHACFTLLQEPREKGGRISMKK
jgi:hypothetical protein